MTAPCLADSHKIVQRIFCLSVDSVLDFNLISVDNELGFNWVSVELKGNMRFQVALPRHTTGMLLHVTNLCLIQVYIELFLSKFIIIIISSIIIKFTTINISLIKFGKRRLRIFRTYAKL